MCKCFIIMLLLLGGFCSAYTIKDYTKLDSLITIAAEEKPATMLDSCNKLISMAKQLGTDSLLVNAYLQQCNLFNNLGMFDMNQRNLYNLLPQFEKKQNHVILSKLYHQLGLSCFQLNDHKLALSFYAKAKQSALAAGLYTDTIRLASEIYLEQVVLGNKSTAIANAKANIVAAKATKNEEIIIICLDNLSNSFFEIGDAQQAYSYQKEMLNYKWTTSNSFNKAAVNQHLAEILIELKDYKQAQQYLNEAIKNATAMGSNDWLYDCYKNQSAIYEANGDFKNALLYHQKYLNTKDSVYKNNYDNSISAMNSFYELSKKEQAILNLQLEKIKAKETIKKLYLLIATIIAALLAYLLYHNNKKNKKEKIARNEFSKQLINTVEEDRQRIAKFLHDGVGQNLLFIKNYISKLNVQDNKLELSTNEALEQIRNVSKELYPNQLKAYGLSAAIEALCDKVRSSTTLFISTDFSLPKESLISDTIKINCYRIIQECISNTMKHANASSLRLTGEMVDNELKIVIQDNGKGFLLEKLMNKFNTSFGLLNIQERVNILNGKFTLESSPGEGTKHKFLIPIYS
jgi:signal transduction histidine kinase